MVELKLFRYLQRNLSSRNSGYRCCRGNINFQSPQIYTSKLIQSPQIYSGIIIQIPHICYCRMANVWCDSISNTSRKLGKNRVFECSSQFFTEGRSLLIPFSNSSFFYKQQAHLTFFLLFLFYPPLFCRISCCYLTGQLVAEHF